MMLKKTAYTKSEAIRWPIPNYWDVIAFCLVFGAIALIIFGAKGMLSPYNLGEEIVISLDPKHLPMYALRTVIRMFIGLFFALLFTFTFGTWAGKSKAAAKLIVPIIDILQSVPVLSFLSITVTGFIAIFKGSMIGPECAAIFAIFTAQAWNMSLSFYQSVRTVPSDLREASKIFHLSSWQQFWRVDVPFAMPGLLWNVMISMSGSWFFVTASEAFSVSNQKITLPGVGSYIALAIAHADKRAILYAILTMLVVIFLYDQLLFRPLAKWVQRFKYETIDDDDFVKPLIARLFQNTFLLQKTAVFFEYLGDFFVNVRFFSRALKQNDKNLIRKRGGALFKILANAFLIFAFILTLTLLSYFTLQVMQFSLLKKLFSYGFLTALRVLALIIFTSFVWVPVGVWVGFRPRLTSFLQPVIQFLAAFPANLAFPVFAIVIMAYDLNVDVWTSPLMILGTQWYILFNVIAGASALPKELKQVASTFKVRGWLLWRRLIFPAIFPYYLTGAITAAGGAWNASILAEVVRWGNINLRAKGLGAFIADAAQQGDFSQVLLGTMIMCLFVLTINRLIWRPLYNLAVEKFSLQ